MAEALGRRVAAGDLDLPSPPDGAARVIAATSREDADLARVAELVRHEPALAAHVLRIANSSLFAAPVPIVSLHQAVLRLGFDGLRKAAYVIAARAAMLRVKGRDREVRATYRHCLLTAGWAQELARVRRFSVEEAFLCGLLHDIGKPVLWQAAGELTASHATGPVQDAEIVEAVAAHHAAAGAAVLATWPAAAALADVVRQHHDAAPEGPGARMIHLLQIADLLGHTHPSDHAAPELPQASLTALALDPEDVALVWRRRTAVQDFARELA